MSRKIILNLAISIDGYISEEDGSYDWIVGDGNTSLNTKRRQEFNKFLEDIDIVVMGKRCYNQGFHKDFSNKKVYVATSETLKDYENISFINKDIVKIILEEKEKEKDGKDIFLFGGGLLVHNFLEEDVIDEYIIGIVPTILGKGRPLFLGGTPKIDLKLEEYFIEEGIIIARYSKR